MARKNNSNRAAEEFVISVILIFFMSWLTMLFMGIWHGVREGIPPVGYWEAVLALCLVRFAIPAPGISRTTSTSLIK